MKPIGSVLEELMECKAEIVKHPKATWFYCIHHGFELEPVSEPIIHRIEFILDFKNIHEQATRFRNLRPVPTASLEKLKEITDANQVMSFAQLRYGDAKYAYGQAYPPAEKVGGTFINAREALGLAKKVFWNLYHQSESMISNLHNQDYPDNTWNGKDIF